jgi:hypothetical protein
MNCFRSNPLKGGCSVFHGTFTAKSGGPSVSDHIVHFIFGKNRNLFFIDFWKNMLTPANILRLYKLQDFFFGFSRY